MGLWNEIHTGFLTGKSWFSWIERLQFHFVAAGIGDPEKKGALLLTLCGAKTYETVRALVTPRRPGDVNLADLVSILEACFDPKPSELYSRLKLQKRDQLPMESNSGYVDALRKLAADCNFGITVPKSPPVSNMPSTSGSITPSPSAAALAQTIPVASRHDTQLPLQVMLRDRFVCGIRDDFLQQRLFAEQDLTFQQALSIAVRAESALQHQQNIKSKTGQPEVYMTATSRRDETAAFSRRPCYRCGEPHEAPDCRFKNQECRFCHKRGHIERVCMAKKPLVQGTKRRLTRTASSTNNVVVAAPVPSPEESDSECGFYDLNQLTQRTAPKLLTSLRIEGKTLQFEVDSSAACSLISEETYRQTWPGKPPELIPSDLELHTWSGEGLRPLGIAHVLVRCKTKDCRLSLLVMKGSGCSLLGRDWFRALSIRIEGVNHKLQQKSTVSTPEVEAC